ncbi:uncharacterized protein LOC119733239 [Patiria miniata]|uniref:Replication protein A OB domain-containing protein n=1 Tax=Patiria miniata TaxID=46514 RepID=A0A914AH84_PATMI|nr:uncharacterized protein LOC119733239 [Patiria miniata]
MSSIDIKILTSPTPKGHSMIAHGITSKNHIVELLIFDDLDRLQSKLTPGKYLKITQYNVTEETNKTKIKLHQKSKIFTTNSFPTDNSIEESFFNAPQTNIDEAKTMPINRRISLEGQAKTVSPTKLGDMWRRKEVQLIDPLTTTSIRCKLWGPHTDKDITEGSMVRITNVEVSMYENVTSVNTTPESLIQEIDTPVDTKVYEITGFDADGDPAQIITDNDITMNITLAKLEALAEDDLPNFQDRLPLSCIITLELATKTVVSIMPNTDAEM